MALNPIVYTEEIVRSFLRYQLTAYPFADERLHAQMRRLLSLDVTRQSPLLKGPYISIARPFREGAAVDELIAEGVLILLTNVKQLELLLTRQKDVDLFAGARLDSLVFDEAHTFTGARGAETACLIRRLRSFCGRDASDTACMATSATIVDEGNPDAARDFASRFFGVPPGEVVTVGEAYEPEVWEGDRSLPQGPSDPAAALATCATAVDDADADTAVRAAYLQLTGEEFGEGEYTVALHSALSKAEKTSQNGIIGTQKQIKLAMVRRNYYAW